MMKNSTYHKNPREMLEYQKAITVSDSGQMSVPIEAVVKLQSFKDNVAAVGRIRKIIQAKK